MANCKPGDLAVIIDGDPDDNVGKFVTILFQVVSQRTRLPDGTCHEASQPFGPSFVYWAVECPAGLWLTNRSGQRNAVRNGVVLDSFLRPIRPAPKQQPVPPATVPADGLVAA